MEEEPYSPPPVKKNSWMVALIPIGIALVLGVGFILFQQFKPSDTASVPATAESSAPESAAPEPPEPTPTPESTEVPLDGTTWEGTMKSGKYEFDMDLTEALDGSLSSTMYQRSRTSGDDGYQTLSGSRKGNKISLQGESWRGAPSGWSTDTIEVTVTKSGSMKGEYTCATCSGWSDIVGRQTS